MWNQFKESILYSEVLGKETETMTLIRTTKQSSKSLSTIEVFFFILFLTIYDEQDQMPG